MSLIASGRVIIVERDQYGNVRYVIQNSDPYCTGDPPFLYWNTPQTYTATCPYDRAGEPVTVIVSGGTFSSVTSQAEADALALAEATSEATAALVCTCLPAGFYNYCDSGNLYQYHEDGACNKSSVILISSGYSGCNYTTTTTTSTTTFAPCWTCPTPINMSGSLYETNVLAYGSVYGAVFNWNGTAYVLVAATKQGTLVYFYPAPGEVYAPGSTFYIVIDGVPICGNLPGGTTTTTTTTTTNTTTTHGPCILLFECEPVSPTMVGYHVIFGGVHYMFVFLKLSLATWRLISVTPSGPTDPVIGHEFSTAAPINIVLNGLTFCLIDPLAICDHLVSTTTTTTTPTTTSTTTTSTTTTDTTSTTTTSTTTTPTIYWNTEQTYTVDCDTPTTTTTSTTTPTTTTTTTTSSSTTTYTTSTTTLNPCNASACLTTGGTWGSNYAWGDPRFNPTCGTCQHPGGPLVYCTSGC